MTGRFAKTEIEQSIPSRFLKQSGSDPDRVAIVARTGVYSYEQLATWSAAIAARLMARAGDRSVPVPFLLPQSPLAIAVTLAILRSGHAYVPLDPSWSPSRLAELCRALAARVVVTDAELAPRLEDAIDAVGVLELTHACPAAAPALPEITIAPGDPAYIYFTSGSTGRPKGVVDCHRNVLHNVMRYTNQLAIDASDRLTLLQSCGFSGAVSSMFAALANGAAALPIDMRKETPARLGDWIEEAGATIYHSVPAVFRSLMTAERKFHGLRIVRLEGDRVMPLEVRLFDAHVAPPCRLAVGLGATETGLVCQYFHDHTMRVSDRSVPIGYAVEDVDVEIRDADGRSAPVGAPGEIVVRSRYLALGYWNDDAATRRAFSSETAHGDMQSYRTGDRGRRAEDGSIDYLGRLDEQVRVRGQWIDLADVEATIAAERGVREAVVAADIDAGGNRRLIAWFVADGVHAPNVSTLHRSLALRLPPHMLPARYVPLERLPLNDNGKVDRARLPRPSPTRPPLATPYVKARDLVELRLAELWERCLDVRPVGIDDDFFELGGDSLLAATMLDEVDTLFARNVPLSKLVEGATIAHLAQSVAARRKDGEGSIVAVRAGGTKEPLFLLHGDYRTGGLYCRELARYLDQARPLYVLPPCGYDGARIPPSYAAHAAIHLSAIRAIQPRGPYHLAGQCNGGPIALEIARRLRATGESVAALVLVASSAQNVRLRALAAIVEIAGRVAGVGPDGRRYAFRRLRDFYVRGMPAKQPWAWARRKLAVLADETARVARMRGRGREAWLDPGAPTSRGTREHIGARYTELGQCYVPGRYEGRVTLLWPRDDPTPASVEATAWRRVVAELDVTEIPGSHNTSLTRHVSDLARALEASIERAQAASP